MNDQRMETIIGVLLRVGVSLAALLVFGGGCAYLWQHGGETASYGTFRGEPAQYKEVGQLFSAATLADGRGWIQIGLVLLILTPIARVLFSVVAFAVERDWTYVFVSCLVAGVLLYSFLRP